MTKIPFAILGRDASDDEVDSFVAALKAKPAAKYRPDQLRAPSGSAQGGEWVVEAGGHLSHITGFRTPEEEARQLEEAAKIAAYGEENGTPGFPKTPEEAAEEALKVLDRATPEEIAAGEVWYANASAEIRAVVDDLAGTPSPTGEPYTFEQACAVTARCSAQRDWGENGPLAELIIRTSHADAPYEITQEVWDGLDVKPTGPDGSVLGPGIYRPSELDPRTDAYANPAYKPSWVRHSREWTSQVAESQEILRGDMETINRIIHGPKLRSFYNNLHNPADGDSVTIDSLQTRVMTPNGLALPGAGKTSAGNPITSSNASISYYTGKFSAKKVGVQVGQGMYSFFAAGMQIATQRANKKRGKKWTPQQVQAITWLVQQREGNQGGT